MKFPLLTGKMTKNKSRKGPVTAPFLFLPLAAIVLTATAVVAAVAAIATATVVAG